MIQNDFQQARLGYLRGLLAARWPVPSRVPTLLAFSRDSSVTAVTFGRLGFRVEEMSADDPLEGLRQQLPVREASYDVVCCWDLPEHHDDWREVVVMLARAVANGGVFFYSVAGRRRKPHGVLRRLGLSPEPLLRSDSPGWYTGYAIRRRDRGSRRKAAA